MSGHPTIFISAYRNFSIRHILYSDIFKELKNSGSRIVVFLRDNDLDYYREKLGDENVVFEPVLYDRAMGSVPVQPVAHAVCFASKDHIRPQEIVKSRISKRMRPHRRPHYASSTRYDGDPAQNSRHGESETALYNAVRGRE